MPKNSYCTKQDWYIKTTEDRLAELNAKGTTSEYDRASWSTGVKAHVCFVLLSIATILIEAGKSQIM